MRGGALTFVALPGVPEVAPGADLAALALVALERAGLRLQANDVLVVAQKVVSKSEGRFVRLADVRPSPRAMDLAAQCHKDPRIVELVLQESTEVVRVAPNVLIARHRCGHVCANAGIDQSNTGATSEEVALLLPLDADASAHALRESLERRTTIAPGVIVSDSFGRPWRLGTVNVALGVAGLPALVDLRGRPDRNGRTLQMTQVAAADALAAGAGLAMGEATEGTPFALVRGYACDAPCSDSRALLRPAAEDLFR